MDGRLIPICTQKKYDADHNVTDHIGARIPSFGGGVIVTIIMVFNVNTYF